MLTLHNFQQIMVQSTREALRKGIRRILLQAPTGAGKTVLTAFMTGNAAKRGKTIWFVVHRRELIRQSSKTFDMVKIPHGIVSAGWDMNVRSPVQICSVQTLVKRLHRLSKPDLLIIDESHHLPAKQFKTVYEWCPKATVIGLTATPRRLDGKGLADYFDTMIQGPTVGELIQQGYLTPYRLFSVPGVQTEGMHHRGGDFKREEVVAALERSTVMGDAVAHYLKHANGRRGLVFEASIERSERLAKSFRDAGIPAAHVDGNTDSMVRDMAMRDLASGALRIICNVDLFGEGVDVPAIEVVHLCRPTDSLTVYLQQVGRGLRLAPGKHDVLIFDHAGNVSRHGRPDDPREWELTAGRTGDKKSEGGFPVRQCPNCYAVNQAGAVKCAECGQLFPIESRQIEQIEGELTEDIVAAQRREAMREQGQAQSLETLTELGRMRGYRNPAAWAKYVWQAREAKQKRRAA